MVITCEISLYPLTSDYETLVFEVIDCLKANKAIQTKTHAMSTFVKGEHSDVFGALNTIYNLKSMKQQATSLVVKIINRDLPVEAGFIF